MTKPTLVPESCAFCGTIGVKTIYKTKLFGKGENALVIELRKRGHRVDQQREFPVHYDGQLIGTLIPDLIVDDLVIADPKVVTAFNDSHVAQMLGYLNITGLQVALLLNFKESKLDWKRVVNERRNRTADNADHADKK